MAVIDDALLPSRYRRIADALKSDVDWSPRHGPLSTNCARSGSSSTAAEVADPSASDETTRQHHFFRHEVFERAKQGRELSPGILDLVRFKALLSSDAFLDWTGLVTGQRPKALQELLIRRMVHGDVAPRHDDAIGGRRLCALLYFSDDWCEAMGGQFVMHAREGDRVIEPLPNRMILFDVNTGLKHSVLPLTDRAKDFQRFNFSIWFR